MLYPIIKDKTLSLYHLSGPIGQALHRLLVIQTFRPDRLLASCQLFVLAIFGDQFLHSAEQELDLAKIVDSEVSGGINN